ncbi:MAG: DUF4418 family protein [Clostridium argentinense]|uniref:DUF4418 family protein n=1 Tax=Clostridium faecium TaxID=2762223 RepID=A0ABR8YTD8_9CLOT|nr:MULTISPECIES: DUF4418 family protein [Clostridium]MBD8047464.1 DUF4418 family protein [Clostridium faecium]MBS5824434.1 DUF4418 family protein [Clostridium argentinense]MDU1350550.1 DUF4418 family protein [Clostridium argentinense]
MKNRVGIGIIYLIAGVLLIFGPQTFIPVCPQGEKIMKCFWTQRAELGIGILFMASGVCVFLTKSELIRLGISISNVFLGVLTFLVPFVLIGGCKNLDMTCRSITFPIFYVIASVVIIVSFLNCFYLRKNIS